ncbi:Molybdopterin synthase catalytic subunit [Micractinium conductrix]|uniref:Molybdopterin synthase catalytic subunit n=1 Tax=Micractinium conductrix TaxID=554055 RepID=A0A2P6V3Q6_9CHLO|nr:Molybdopterin synthase catalytic subunit [Micractinium conductrix]|eukprot:PSC68707.1 Molybdopterin synthase catalytic subunit [Micractinium conductrix]
MAEGEAGHQAALLLRAAAEAVRDFQAGRAAPSVPDILHLEKRWARLPAADTGSVAVEDALHLLGAEVLEGEPLEFVAREVLAAQGAAGAALLTKRQFLALAHVAEQAQSKAFDLVTAEDAAAPRADPAADRHKKRPPPIRDAHLDSWRIAAAVPLQDGDSELEDGDAPPAELPPGPLGEGLAAAQGGGGLSRAVSLAARPLEAGAAALSRQNSFDGGEAAAAAAAAQRAQQLHESAATSYQSALEAQEGEAQLEGFAVLAEEGQGADEEAAPEEAAPPLSAAVDEFTNKLNGLMDRMSDDMARLQVEGAAEGGADAADAAAVPGADAPARGSWESFGSGGSGRAGTAAAAVQAPPQQLQQQTPPQQQTQQMNEAMISAAMAAGMTFMQHLQAAGAGGTAVPSPFADVNPLRQAAAAAAAAMAASPQLSAGGGSSGGGAPEPAAHGGREPQQVIAEMLAQLRMGGATSEQLHAAAVSLEQHALAAQQQQQQQSVGSRAASVGSASAASAAQQQLSQQQASRGRSWRSNLDDDENVAQQAQPQYRSRDASVSPHKPSRLGPHASASAGPALSAQAARDAADMPPPAPRLRPPTVEGIAGWTPMTADDLQRCQAIFKKKGYSDVGGMERHYAMEYFAKLRMEGSIFHAAWAASDLGGDGRLDCREFCLFVQLLRGAQKGRPLPARLSPEEAAALLGERAMPEALPAPLHIDTAHMRAVLGGSHSRQGSVAEQEHSVMQDFDQFDDDASSVDSGIAESVVSSVMSLGPRRPGGHPLARPAVTHHRTGLGSVLGAGPGGAGGAAYGPAYARAEAHGAMPRAYPAPSLSRMSAGGDASAAHSLLEVAVKSAEIRYRKPLSTPIFTLSVRDSLGRLVELPIDTHPGHYRRETSMIYSSAIVRLTSQLRSIPPGSVLFLEIKHWKADKKRFSTLAWSYAPLEKLIDFGPSTARVRNGPVDLPLLKKPVDLTLRRTRRLTSRAYDLHLTMRGVDADGESVRLRKFPAMSSDTAEVRDGTCFAEVTPEPLDLNKYVEMVADDGAGAIATFSGVTRNSFQGKRTEKLEYEAYVPMAARKLLELCHQACARWTLCKAAIAHRTGTVLVGEASVVIAFSSAHRREALEACHWAIDELKATVPIWKKEFFEGGEVWKENEEWRAEQRRLHDAAAAARAAGGAAGASAAAGAAAAAAAAADPQLQQQQQPAAKV